LAASQFEGRAMSFPGFGSVDPLAVVALGFLAAVLVISLFLFAWITGQARKRAGER
jgi:hypothetical protein